MRFIAWFPDWLRATLVIVAAVGLAIDPFVGGADGWKLLVTIALAVIVAIVGAGMPLIAESAAAPQYAQAATFERTFASFWQIAVATQPSQYVDEGWRTSRTKILDNAVIGYCKISNIGPAHT